MSFNAEHLTGPQRVALGQLQAITNGADIPSEIAILSSVNWDVQRAAEAIFDAQTTTTSTKLEQMQFDDSTQASPAVSWPRRPSSPIVRLGLHLVSIATFPVSLSFNILSHLVHFLFRSLRIPFPRLNLTSVSFTFFTRSRPPALDDPASAADRFVRALEDETGAQVISRARASASTSRNEPGPSSSVVAQDPLSDDTRKVLPDFWLGGYESALDVVRRELRVLCIILLSSEHDDVPAFRRNVLTDPILVRALVEHDILVWGGDVRDQDAYQASLKLTATTYPFVAFVALQPRAGNGDATGSTSTFNSPLTVLSRHAGANATSAMLLARHITTTLIPRHQPFLSRLQDEVLARARDRTLRAEQDAAFAAAQHADTQRILQRREEEAERVRAEEARRAAESAERRAAVRRVLWRREALVRLEKGEGHAGVRIGVRVPDGRRAVGWFREGDQVADVYAWVDSVLAEGREDDAPTQNEVSETSGNSVSGHVSALDDIPEWRFRLAVAFPRSAVPCVAGQRVGDVAALRGGGNLVVESIAPVVESGSETEEED